MASSSNSNANVNVTRTPGRPPKKGYPMTITIPTDEFRSLPIPGVNGTAKLSECFVKVTDIPEMLDKYMEVNPRVPSRTDKGVLTGPVANGILDTLRNHPEEMVVKNLGIFLLADEANFKKTSGGKGVLEISLLIVTGKHLYRSC